MAKEKEKVELAALSCVVKEFEMSCCAQWESVKEKRGHAKQRWMTNRSFFRERRGVDGVHQVLCCVAKEEGVECYSPQFGLSPRRVAAHRPCEELPALLGRGGQGGVGETLSELRSGAGGGGGGLVRAAPGRAEVLPVVRVCAPPMQGAAGGRRGGSGTAYQRGDGVRAEAAGRGEAEESQRSEAFVYSYLLCLFLHQL